MTNTPGVGDEFHHGDLVLFIDSLGNPQLSEFLFYKNSAHVLAYIFISFWGGEAEARYVRAADLLPFEIRKSL